MKLGDGSSLHSGSEPQGDGHSTLCRFLADKFLYELEEHQRVLDSSSVELRAAFIENGMPEDAAMDFRLVRRAELNVSEDHSAKMEGR